MITNEQADVLAHTSRNGRYVTDEAAVIAMGEAGLLYDHGPQALAGGMHYLVMTSKGREALSEWKAAQPKPPPCRRRQRTPAFSEWWEYHSRIPFGKWWASVKQEMKYGKRS